jgi:glycosyltransferase involved in cell wall biosynthesis
MNKLPISVMILTYNEADNLALLLESIQQWADEVFILDSFSTDQTCAIAEGYGATVVPHAFEGHTRQRNWGLRNLPFRNAWLFALDADHRVTPALAAELQQVFAQPPQDINGFFVKRRQIFRGKWIRHGAYYPKWQLKLFQHQHAYCDDLEFDYRFYVAGTLGYLQNDILEDNRKENEIDFWISKHNKFATETAREEIKRRAGTYPYQIQPALFGNPDERVLWLKHQWYKSPLYVRPFLYFFYRYFIRLGFLDGKQGFIFHFLQAFWFRLLVDIKLDEMLQRKD